MPDPKPSTPDPDTGRLNIVAGVLAAVLPGLGHFYLGQKRRAAYAASGILGLFFGGLLIGGIDVIDAREDRWWFLGQSFVGPLALGANWLHQNHFKVYEVVLPTGELSPTNAPTIYEDELPFRFRSAGPNEKRVVADVSIIDRESGQTRTQALGIAVPAGDGEGPPNRKSLAKVNELGTLYALCAGMMNLIAILDALVPTRAPGHDQRNAQARAAQARRDDQADDPVHPDRETVA